MSKDTFGSGSFGYWFRDEQNLPAYKYTCDQTREKIAQSPTHEAWRMPTEHLHQVGNDRIVGIASNYGYVQIRQDEGSPKLLNDYNPPEDQYGGGIGYLTDGEIILSTFFSGKTKEYSFDRIFGMGYYRKIINHPKYSINQVIFAPFGDNPIMISQVTIKNLTSQMAKLRWVEAWAGQQYQLSYKSFMISLVKKIHPTILRRELAKKMIPTAETYGQNQGLILKHRFQGYTPKELKAWKSFEFLASTVLKKSTGGNIKPRVKEASFDDLAPPTVFLVSLDDQCSGFEVNAHNFYGSGGVNSPDGLKQPLGQKLSSIEKNQGLFLERSINLNPQQEVTLTFAFGYLENMTIDQALIPYQGREKVLFHESCQKWHDDRISFQIKDDPWIDRELMWHNYYLRSNLTYDRFFQEHIESQGHVYQYLLGFNGAARDSIQHVMPFIYSQPKYVKEILRYNLKSTSPSGEIPYGIVGSGMLMPSPFKPSDLELWLIWVTSEYVLATRDIAFLDEDVPLFPIYDSKPVHRKIKDILKSCYQHFVIGTGVGQHGIPRLSNGDWNDMVVHGYVKPKEVKEVKKSGESVLNGAMAVYVFSLYAQLLEFLHDSSTAAEIMRYVDQTRKAIQPHWTGSWFKRAWLSKNFGWIGEDYLWAEPQPWAILSDITTPEQCDILIQQMDILLRKPSKIGALLCSQPDSHKSEAPGMATNAGIWPSINGTLIMALAKANSGLAWDEWKKNTLAYHAEAYPNVWYGIWSGPDTYNSELSKYPGQTVFKEPTNEPEKPKSEKKGLEGIEVSWTDFPVMNMHPHAWPLYNIPSLLGITFTSKGVHFAPVLPLKEYQFTSPLVDFIVSDNEISGKYHPLQKGVWQIQLKLPPILRSRFGHLEVNGFQNNVDQTADLIKFAGVSTPDKALIWKLLP